MNLKELVQKSRERKAIRDAERERTKRRVRYTPGRKENCAVCGKHRLIAHWNHYLPVAMQADAGISAPAGIWLCPNHHAMYHALEEVKSESEWSKYTECMDAQEVAKLHEIVEERARTLKAFFANSEYSDRYHKAQKERYGL